MTKILDQYGQPFNLNEIAEPQTARIAALRHSMITSQLGGLTPAKAARILAEADQGDLTAQAQLFDDMLDRDAHLLCEMDKRASALVGLDWRIVPPKQASAAEKASAEWVEETLSDVVDDLEDVILAMMDAVGHGFSTIELEWVRDGKEFIPSFHPRPQTWFRTDIDRRELRLNDGSKAGAIPLPMGWIMHQHRKVKTGYLGRAGIFRAVLWPFLYKAYSIGDFAEFLETYGLPILLGKYQTGASDEEKTSLMRAVSALGHDARAIMPEGMSIEIQKIASSGGGGNPHLDMVAWADGAQSKAILGQVLSAEAKATGMGSGVASLHAEVRDDIRRSDARQLAGTLTRDLVYPLVALNRPGIDGMRRCPRFEFDLGEADDLTAYAEALPKLAAAGVQIPVAWVGEKLRIPAPQKGEAVLGAAAMNIAGKPAPTTALSSVGAGLPATADLYAIPRAAPEMADWLETIRAMLDASETLEQFRDTLLTAYPEIDRAGMVAAMAEAFTAAHLWGMAEP